MLKNLGKHFYIRVYHDYEFSQVNWIEFTFITLYFERDYYSNTLEFHIGLLGFHFWLIYSIDVLDGELK